MSPWTCLFFDRRESATTGWMRKANWLWRPKKSQGAGHSATEVVQGARAHGGNLADELRREYILYVSRTIRPREPTQSPVSSGESYHRQTVGEYEQVKADAGRVESRHCRTYLQENVHSAVFELLRETKLNISYKLL